MEQEKLLYSRDHEWVGISNGTATVGISDYAQDTLGDIVYLDLPNVGSELAMGDVVGEIESVKSTSDLITPVSGTVIEINQDTIDHPEIVNEKPYDSGWLYKVKLSDPSELDELMNAEEYEEYTKEL